jgi:hypothetical protein
VKYLLDNIESSDPELNAAIALVKQDKGDNGKMNNFDACAVFIIPCCPVARKRLASNKRNGAQISMVEGSQGKNKSGPPQKKQKKGMGTSGVELRYYAPKEYIKLNDEQKAELWQWRQNRKAANNNPKPAGNITVSSLEASIASAVSKQFQLLLDQQQKQAQDHAAAVAVVQGGAPIPKKASAKKPLKSKQGGSVSALTGLASDEPPAEESDPFETVNIAGITLSDEESDYDEVTVVEPETSTKKKKKEKKEKKISFQLNSITEEAQE